MLISLAPTSSEDVAIHVDIFAGLQMALRITTDYLEGERSDHL